MSHFYDTLGNSVYEVERSDGKGLRDTTLRDARKLKLLPSVTTITGVLAKPGLTNWLQEQTISACFSTDRQKEGEVWEDYVRRIIHASNDVSRQASERGSYLHDLLEKFFKKETDLQQSSKEDNEYIIPVIDLIDKELGVLDWTAEKSFADSTGYGGKVDLCCFGSKTPIVLDFKTKNTDNIKKFYRYDEHLMQLSAYRQGLGIPTARCFDLYFSAVKPGILELHEWSEEELQKGLKMFNDLLDYWKLTNNFNPAFEKQNA